jgi:hypothetical protein
MSGVKGVFVRSLSGSVLLLSLTWACHAARIGFLVAEYPNDQVHGDSFVVTIEESDSERLAHARALVAWIESGADLETAPDGRIVFTEMADGADGVNRNVLAAGEPLWSWHPVGEVDFVDISAEVYDGWPTFVEQDVAAWIANTGGGVGFWGYTITKELGVVPEPSTLAPSLMALVLIRLAFRRPSRVHFASRQIA